jgi:hypothetical protein
MFKVGATYRITLRENGENTELIGCKVIAVDMPHIKIEQNGDERILNTTSLCFVAAKRDD